MTSDVERFAFLLRQKPICTQSPIKSALGSDRHRELRAEYKLALGVDLMDDRCPNSFNCLSASSGCIGRPFPIDDEVAEALGQINVTVEKGIFKGRQVYLAKAVVTCAGCPFAGKCEISCATQDSFLSRHTRPESNPPENTLVPYDKFEQGMYKALTPDDIEHCDYGDWADEQLPLDCLTGKQRQVIEMTLYEGLEQAEIADRLNIGIPRVSLHLSRAKAKLEEFGKARRAIREAKLIPNVVVEYYVYNKTQSKIAVEHGISQPRVTQILTSWYKSIHPK